MRRVIALSRPTWVIGENVTGLISLALDDVLSDLEGLRYTPRTFVIPAAAVGAPHRRDRLWIIATNSDCSEIREQPERSDGTHGEDSPQPHIDGSPRTSADADRCRQQEHGERHSRPEAGLEGTFGDDVGRCGTYVADATGQRQQIERHAVQHCPPTNAWEADQFGGSGEVVGHADSARLAIGQSERGNSRPQFTSTVGADWWITEPGVGRVAHGVPRRVDRLRCLGNAVVPQIVEEIGRAIMRVSK